MIKYLFFLSLLLSVSSAKELFSVNKIALYLNKENPFVYTLYAQEYNSKEREKYFLSAFDTTFSAKYDKKEYPASTGEYYDVSLKKITQSGVELLTSYRKAGGTQEYNNIKTGDEGELLVGVKLPILALLNDTNTKKLALDVAHLNSKKFASSTDDKLRVLYLNVLNSYYTLLYSKILVDLEKELLETSKTRAKIIEKKVELGSMADIAALEAQQQIINRQQRYLSAQNSYENSFTSFVRYLNTTKEKFTQQYDLINVLDVETLSIDLDDAIDRAVQNRPDLKMLKYEKEQLYLQKKNSALLKYPSFNASFYGVHDFKYNEGYKVSLDMNFPLERNKYESNVGVINKSLKNIEKIKAQKIRNIKTNLKNIVHSLNTLSENINYSKQELELVKKLQAAENKKYMMGASNLFMLNQRETYTLEVQKKLLQHKLKYLILKEEFYKELGENRVTHN